MQRSGTGPVYAAGILIVPETPYGCFENLIEWQVLSRAPSKVQDSTVSRTGSGTRSGGNGRAKACCCRAERSEPVRSKADIDIPQIIAGEIEPPFTGL